MINPGLLILCVLDWVLIFFWIWIGFSYLFIELELFFFHLIFFFSKLAMFLMEMIQFFRVIFIVTAELPVFFNRFFKSLVCLEVFFSDLPFQSFIGSLFANVLSLLFFKFKTTNNHLSQFFHIMISFDNFVVFTWILWPKLMETMHLPLSSTHIFMIIMLPLSFNLS